jgi:hypothetical protein
MAVSVYPVLKQAKCYTGVGVVHVLRCVVAGQMMSGWRDLQSAEMHSIVVIKVRFTLAPLQFRSSLAVNILRELRTLQRTPISSIVDIFL